MKHTYLALALFALAWSDSIPLPAAKVEEICGCVDPKMKAEHQAIAGAMRRNLAMNGRGNRWRYFKDGTGNHGLGFNGIGFWFQGRNVVVEDNVATSQNEAGFFWFHRSYVENPEIPLETLRFPQQHNRNFDLMPDGRLATSLDSIPLRGLRDNMAVACTHLLSVVKAGPDQGHDQRSMFGHFTGWNVETATNIEYTAFYTLVDWTLVRDGIQNMAAGAQW